MEKQQVKIRNRILDEDRLHEMRRDVLVRWPTGREIDFQETVGYLRGLPEGKSVYRRVAEAKEKGFCLTQPRGGFPLLEDMMALHHALETDGDAHVLLPVTTDSYTRSERFGEVEKALEVCRREKRSVINGYPTVNHGLRSGRKLQESTSRPLFALGGNPLPCLNVEMSFACGVTGYLGSGICVPVGYSKHVTIEQCIKNYQYVDRLTSLYAENGVQLYRETAGFLTWTLVPPGVEIAMNVIDALLAAEQGVRIYAVNHSAQLNLVQDTATVAALQEICQEYLHRFGHTDVELFTTLVSYGPSFPENEPMAYGTLSAVAAVAGLTGVQGVSVKTVDEAKAVPTAEANAAACRATRQLLSIFGGQRYPRTPDVEFEIGLLRTEVRSILNRVLELGDGDVAVGAVLAFEYGILDCPWSPNLCVKGKVLGARDRTGAVRYLDTGNVPIPKEVVEYHREALAERARRQNRPLNYEMILDDLLSVAQGRCLAI